MLIKGVWIIDGTGKKAYKGDIFISGETISAIGDFSGRRADSVIDGLGLYAAPGFININTDSDHFLSLFTHPDQRDFLEQGFTTVIGGQCGVSLAPLLYGDLRMLRMWTDPYQINVGWNTVRELFAVLRRLRLGVNFGTLAGHTTIRSDVVGDEFRDATDQEQDIMNHLADDSLQDGAFGFSSGLGYYFGKHIPYAELLSFAQILAQRNGIMAIHLRDEMSGIVASVKEVLRLAKESGAHICISHFRPVVGFEKEYEDAAALLMKAQKTHPSLFVDVFPFRSTRLPLTAFVPTSHQQGTLTDMTSELRAVRDDIKSMITQYPRKQLADACIISAPYNTHLIGESLRAFSSARNMSVVDSVFELMVQTKLRAVLEIPHLNITHTLNVLSYPRAILATNSASSVAESSPSVIPNAVHQILLNSDMSLEEIIARLTSLPAEAFRIPRRGVLAEGNSADIVLFSAQQGKRTQVPRIHHVIVNGHHAVKNGIVTGITAGKVIMRKTNSVS